MTEFRKQPLVMPGRAQPLWPLGLAVVLIVAGCAALAIDIPLARWLRAVHIPRELKHLIELSEVFAYGGGAAMIILTVAVLDPPRRRAVPRLAVASLGAGLLVDAMKLLVTRWRPQSFDFASGATQTFIAWLPGLGHPNAEHSFYSAHSATAAGLALALAWLYPRGGWFFALLAVLACCQRLVVEAHFLSDVLWGAASGLIVAWLVIYFASIARVFDRFERHGTP